MSDYDSIVLPTGRGFYANLNIVGIDANGKVFEGYDGCVEIEKFSREDKIALADLMLGRWQKFKDEV